MQTKASASDCPENMQKYSEEINKLKTIIDLKPKVVEHFNIIRDKFPCNHDVREFLWRFVSNFCYKNIKFSVPYPYDDISFI